METLPDTAEPARAPVEPAPPGTPQPWRERLWLLLLPELRQFPPAGRARARQRAGRTEPDVVELVLMAIGLVGVTALTRYGLPDPTLSSRLALALGNFALALPLLVAVLGPLHLRRLRRGLRQQLRTPPR